MNWKKLSRWILPILIVFVLIAMQATLFAAAKPATAPLVITDTPKPEITNTPGYSTPHPTKTPQGYYPPGPRPRPGGPGNLDIRNVLIVGGLAILVVALWFVPRMKRRSGS